MLQQGAPIHIFIPGTVRHRATDSRARQWLIVQVLPPHRQRRQMPIGSAGHARAVRITFLMATHAIQRGHAFSFRTTNDVGEMTMAIVALLWIVCGSVTVDAAR